jgi:hypothetical protein
VSFNACANVHTTELTSKRLGFRHMSSPPALLIVTPRPTNLRNNASAVFHPPILIHRISIPRVFDKHHQRRTTEKGRIILDPGLGL